MTDRELLEAAARAAGIDLYIEWDDSGPTGHYRIGRDGNEWNPLTDDGDALRLAVKLRIDVKWHFGLDDSVFAGVAYKGETQMRERLQQDDNAATRRAIVRAAAAMAPKEQT